MTTSLTGADLSGTATATRRLAVFSAATGLAGVIVLVIGLGLGGVLNGSPASTSLAVLGLAAMVTTVLTGHQAGLYLGLGLIVIASRTIESVVSTPRFVLFLVALMVAHEAIRLCLDARRPTRFGPGFLRTHTIQSSGPIILVAALSAILHPANPSKLPAIVVPIGFGAIAAFLFTRRAMAADALQNLTRTVRFLLIPALSVVLLGTITLAARARAMIESTRPTVQEPSPPPLGAPVERLPPLGLDAGANSPPLALFVLLVAFVISGLLYLALRRPEADYELEAYDPAEFESALDLVGPASVATEEESTPIDEQAFGDLLDELSLEITTEHDPGRAIRFGYANVQRRLGQNDLQRDDDETEREFLHRALPSLGADAEALTQLTTLFEHARFSHEPVDESMRQQALLAVAQLRDQLGKPSEDSSP